MYTSTHTYAHSAEQEDMEQTIDVGLADIDLDLFDVDTDISDSNASYSASSEEEYSTLEDDILSQLEDELQESDCDSSVHDTWGRLGEEVLEYCVPEQRKRKRKDDNAMWTAKIESLMKTAEAESGNDSQNKVKTQSHLLSMWTNAHQSIQRFYKARRVAHTDMVSSLLVKEEAVSMSARKDSAGACVPELLRKNSAGAA